MKLLSFNCCGLASSWKKMSLEWLVDSTKPYVILLQETLGDMECVRKALEALYPGWCFDALDARGRSGGLEIGWRSQACRCENI